MAHWSAVSVKTVEHIRTARQCLLKNYISYAAHQGDAPNTFKKKEYTAGLSGPAGSRF